MFTALVYQHTQAGLSVSRRGMPWLMRSILVFCDGSVTIGDLCEVLHKPLAPVQDALGQLLEMGYVDWEEVSMPRRTYAQRAASYAAYHLVSLPLSLKLFCGGSDYGNRNQPRASTSAQRPRRASFFSHPLGNEASGTGKRAA